MTFEQILGAPVPPFETDAFEQWRTGVKALGGFTPNLIFEVLLDRRNSNDRKNTAIMMAREFGYDIYPHGDPDWTHYTVETQTGPDYQLGPSA